MKALIFLRPWDVRVEQVPDPRIENARDAIVRVTLAAISGDDVKAYEGLLSRRRRAVLGREFMGVVEEVGPRVEKLKRGDRVAVACAVACGDCWYCLRSLPNQCEKAGAGEYGGQAQYVRVPFADVAARKLPPQLSDERALFLGSVIPAAWEAAEWCGIKGGETVAVFGCGPVGLMTMRAARFMGAARVIGVDPDAGRREHARRLADAETLDPEDAVEAIRARTDGRGADACVDTVGPESEGRLRHAVSNVLHRLAVPRTLLAVVGAVRRGGAVSVVGASRAAAGDFPINEVFEKGLRLRGGEPPVHTRLDFLLAQVLIGNLWADDLITHQFPLDDSAEAYDLLAAKRENALKVVLHPWQEPPREEDARLDEVQTLRGALPNGPALRPDDTSIGAE